MNGYYDGLVVPIIMKYFGPQSWVQFHWVFGGTIAGWSGWWFGTWGILNMTGWWFSMG